MDKNRKTKMGWNFHNSYIELSEELYTKIKPIAVKEPEIFILNKDLAESLGLNLQLLKTKEGAETLTGNIIPEGADPIAQAYAGHQFGHFTMLGDGRAILLGEHIDPMGNRFDIQFKGSGKTPYSRGGDGKASLGPMLREYITSESMAGFGIATTRSLAVTTTGEKIARGELEKAAILTRIASSHIRVGTFQYLAAHEDRDLLKELADYTIKRHFPDLLNMENSYLFFLRKVIEKQARLISKWQLVGFIHGVMNTDNMTISGESIDYGPCAFMDIYDKKTVFSSIDRHGRYSYGNQPDIGAWNLSRFGETLLPLLSNEKKIAIKLVEDEIHKYYQVYDEFWENGMRAKLGIFQNDIEDKEIISELLYLMEKYKADYTNLFRELTMGHYSSMDIYREKEFQYWKTKWEKRLSKQAKSKDEIKELMRASNPSIIPRNIWVEQALEAAEKGNRLPMEKLLKVISNPYDYTEEQNDYYKLPIPSNKTYRTFCGT